MEKTDGVQIVHCRNGLEYRLPELPRSCVESYCPETNTMYESFWLFLANAHVPTISGVTTLSDDTLAERHERKMSRLEQITRAGYQVKVQ